MKTLQELMVELRDTKQRKAELLAKPREGVAMTEAERHDYQAAYALEGDLQTQINARQSQNTLALVAGGDFSKLAAGGPTTSHEWAPEGVALRGRAMPLSHDYRQAFETYIGSNGTKLNAALYEGSNPAGGFIVPVVVEGNVVPLAPTDMGVRSIASVIPTAMDIKIPRATTISTAAGKAEGTGNGSNLFAESEPTLDQFTLSAFMAGVLHQISWELAQDVPSFQSFAVGDMLLAQQLYEENLYVNGTGTNQAQGLIGNCGAGVTGVAAGSDNYASELLAATFDVQSALKTAYHQNAGWLMSRATATVIKKQQSQTNLYTPVWTRENGKDYLHGYPVTFSTAMPSIAAGTTPVLFGDFKTGYVIGDRGGSGINVKILDQPKATEGILMFLAYRRTDGRVRRSEAIQAITLHS
jgi:HK97 family phage major capsid protein